MRIEQAKADSFLHCFLAIREILFDILDGDYDGQ